MSYLDAPPYFKDDAEAGKTLEVWTRFPARLPRYREFDASSC